MTIACAACGDECTDTDPCRPAGREVQSFPRYCDDCMAEIAVAWRLDDSVDWATVH